MSNKNKEDSNGSENSDDLEIWHTVTRPLGYLSEMMFYPVPGKTVAIHIPKNLEEVDKIMLNKNNLISIRGRVLFKKPMEFPVLRIMADSEPFKSTIPKFLDGNVELTMWGEEYEIVRDNLKNIHGVIVTENTKNYSFCNSLQDLYKKKQNAISRNDKEMFHVYDKELKSIVELLRVHPDKNKHLNEYSYVSTRSRLKIRKMCKHLAENEKVSRIHATDTFFRLGYEVVISFIDYESKVKHYKRKYSGENLGDWKYEGSNIYYNDLMLLL